MKYLSPAYEIWGKVMFYRHLSLCQQGVFLATMPWVRQTPPPPPPAGRSPSARRQTSSEVKLPQKADPTPQKAEPPEGRPPPPQKTDGQEAGGTHPTEMYTCSITILARVNLKPV